MRAPSLVAMLCLLLAGGTAVADSYDPGLSTFATAHRIIMTKIGEKRDAAARAPRDEYLVALEMAQKEAIENKERKLASRIGGEMQAVKSGSFRTTEGFPRKLLSARKALENALSQADTDAEREAKSTNASYLADLNRIPTGPDPNSLLNQQIASEKKALATGIIGPVINPETDLAGTRWQLTGGGKEVWTFSQQEEMKVNDRWPVTFPEPGKIVVQRNKSVRSQLSLAKDGRTLLQAGKPFAKLAVEKE